MLTLIYSVQTVESKFSLRIPTPMNFGIDIREHYTHTVYKALFTKHYFHNRIKWQCPNVLKFLWRLHDAS